MDARSEAQPRPSALASRATMQTPATGRPFGLPRNAAPAAPRSSAS